MNDDGTLIYKNQGNSGLLDLLCLPPGRLLDCGCGAGDNARILSSLGWKVTALTLDPREKAVVQSFCEAVEIADLEQGIPVEINGKFNVVLASHVLEHLVRPERLLHDIQHRLSPSGVLAVALPNIAHYSQRILRLRGDFHYTETGQLDRTHVRFYTYETALRLLEQNGYELIHAGVEGTLPWWKARRLLSLSPLRRVDQWTVRRTPNLFGKQTLMIAKPDPRYNEAHSPIAPA